MTEMKEPTYYFVRHIVAQLRKEMREKRISKFEVLRRLLLTSAVVNAGSLDEGVIEFHNELLTKFFKLLGGDDATGSFQLTPEIVLSRYQINNWDYDLFVTDSSSVDFLVQVFKDAMPKEKQKSQRTNISYLKEVRDDAV